LRRLLFNLSVFFILAARLGCQPADAQESDVKNSVSSLEETAQYIKSLSAFLPLDEENKDFINKIPELRNEVQTLLKERFNARELAAQPLETLLERGRELEAEAAKIEKSGKLITARLASITSAREELKGQEERWKKTIQFLTEGSSSKTIDSRVNELSGELANAEKAVQIELDTLLIAQSDTTKLVSQLAAAKEDLEKIIEHARSQIFIKDAGLFFQNSNQALSCGADCLEVESEWGKAANYITENFVSLLLTLVSSALFGFVLYRLIHHTGTPWSGIVFVFLALVVATLPTPPLFIRAILYLLVLFPTIRAFYFIVGENTWWLPSSALLLTLCADLLQLFGAYPAFQHVCKAFLLALASVMLLIAARRTKSYSQSAYPRTAAILHFACSWAAAIGIVAIVFLTLGFWRLGSTVFESIISLYVSGLIGVFIFSLVKQTVHALIKRITTTGPSVISARYERLGKTAVGLVATLSIIGVSWSGLAQFGFDRELLRVLNVMLAWGISFGSVSVTVKSLLVSLIVLWLGLQGAEFLRDILTYRFFPKSALDSGAQYALQTGVYYLLVLMTVILSLAALGVNVQSLTIVAGALSLGAGFGLQHIVNNIVSGMILLIERPIKPGDLILIGDVSGTVTRLSLRSTTIKTADEAEVIIPNSKIVGEQVTNYTHSSTMGRFTVHVYVVPETDIDKCSAALREACSDVKGVLKFPAADVHFRGAKEQGFEFTINAAVADVGKKLSIETELIRIVHENLEKSGIELSFLRRDVRVFQQ
jgi:small-conductance mechanosensitive channel